MRLLIVFSQDFLYYQEKLPEFDADEEVASLMCVIDLHSVAFLVLSLICHAHSPLLAVVHVWIHCKFSLTSRLIKQTYSIFVDLPTGRRKWHLGQPSLGVCFACDDAYLSVLVLPSGIFYSSKRR